MIRAVVATLVGLVTAIAVDFGVNALIVGSPPHGYGSMQSLTGPWGVISGVVFGLLSAFVTFYLRLPDRARRTVWAAVGATFILLGVIFVMFGFAYGVPPITSLEGAWMHPTWMLLFGFGTFAVIKSRRTS